MLLYDTDFGSHTSYKNAIPSHNQHFNNHKKTNENQAIGGNRNTGIRAVPAISHYQGSLTVEAALTMPICLGVLLLLIGLFGALRTYEQINHGLSVTARQMAAYSEAADGNSLTDAYRIFNLGGGKIDADKVVGGRAGIVLSVRHSETDPALLKLKACYMLKIPSFFGSSKYVSVTDIVYAREWTGTPFAKSAQESSIEHHVYVAENGIVYHKDNECTYLELSITTTDRESVKQLRNVYGEKYTPCEKCASLGGSGEIFITKQGNAWHTGSGCSGLKRTVGTCTEADAKSKGLHACPRCGGE